MLTTLYIFAGSIAGYLLNDTFRMLNITHRASNKRFKTMLIFLGSLIIKYPNITVEELEQLRSAICYNKDIL